MAAAWPAGLRATRRTAACLNGGGRTRLDGRANNRDRGRSARRRLGRPNWRDEDVRGCGRRRKSPWGGLVRACHCGFRSMTGRLHGEATKGACGQGGKQSDEATKGAGCLHLHGLTGGIGAPGLNTSTGLPAASMFVAPMAAAPLMQPVGVVPGEPLPIISQSADIGTPTEFLLLKNMFDPAVETDPDFDLDITDDVQDECSKFGVVKHIFVDKRTAGFVYLHFDSATAATSAQRSLHGRWFAGWILLKRREVERHQ